MRRTCVALAATLSVVCLLGMANQVQAAPFTPDFSDYPFPGSQFTVDAAANAFFGSNYGITVDNAYLYVDPRDTFDQIGLSNGEVSEIGSMQTARITFLDTTDVVTIDWFSIEPTIYQVFAIDGTQLDSTFSVAGNLNGTHLFTGGGTPIAYLTWTTHGGFGQVSGLSYDYDGTTDGRNDDLPGSSVPEPATISLMALSLFGFGVSRRRARD